MVLCPSLLLIVTKYADLGQVQIRTQRSRELPSNLVAALQVLRVLLTPYLLFLLENLGSLALITFAAFPGSFDVGLTEHFHFHQAKVAPAPSASELGLHHLSLSCCLPVAIIYLPFPAALCSSSCHPGTDCPWTDTILGHMLSVCGSCLQTVTPEGRDYILFFSVSPFAESGIQ